MRQGSVTWLLIGLVVMTATGSARAEDSAELLIRGRTWAEDVIDRVLGRDSGGEEAAEEAQPPPATAADSRKGGPGSSRRSATLLREGSASASEGLLSKLASIASSPRLASTAPTYERGDVTFDYDVTTGGLGVQDSVAAPDPQSTRISISELLQNDFGLSCAGSCELPKINKLQMTGFSGNANIQSITQRGGFLYIAAASAGESATFDYEVFDRGSGTRSSVQVKIWFGNRKPQARDDDLVVFANSQSLFDISALLANDSDPDGDPLDLVRVWYPQNGQVSLRDVDGVLKVFFEPDKDFVGEAYFNYTIADLSAAQGVVVAGVGAASLSERMTFARGIVRVRVLASPS